MKITEALLSRKHSKLTWKRLFKKFNFFQAYNHFVQIQILSKDDIEGVNFSEKWTGYIESKIRKLLGCFEKFNELKGNIMEFRPWPKAYRLENTEYANSEAYYFGIRIKKNPAAFSNENNGIQRVDFKDTIKIFYQKLKEWLIYDETLMKWVKEKTVDIRITYHSRETLPDEVRPRVEAVFKYDGNTILGKRKTRENDDGLDGIENELNPANAHEIVTRDDATSEIV